MTTDTLAKLAACPFCGDEPRTIERPDNIDGTEFFYAVMCYCGGYSATAHKMATRKTPEQAKVDAIEAWNRRALSAQAPAMPADFAPSLLAVVRIYTEQADAGIADDGELFRAVCRVAGVAQALPAAEPFGYFKAQPFGWTDCAETDEGAVALYERPQHHAGQVPATHFTGAFAGVAGRKLADMQAKGYAVNGYSLMHQETRQRGFIDAGGFVGWWSSRDHGQAAQAGCAIDERFASKLAFMLECVLIDHHGQWDAAAQLLDEYKAEWEKVNPSPPTFMGEPMPPERKERLLKRLAEHTVTAALPQTQEAKP